MAFNKNPIAEKSGWFQEKKPGDFTCSLTDDDGEHLAYIFWYVFDWGEILLNGGTILNLILNKK